MEWCTARAYNIKVPLSRESRATKIYDKKNENVDDDDEDDDDGEDDGKDDGHGENDSLRFFCVLEQ